jgi:putative SOS response-associated peptidase YedK
MCGRYTLAADRNTLLQTFPDFVFPTNLPIRYNIAPTQPVAVAANNNGGEVEAFHWGLIPFWAKDSAIGNKLINARSESLHEKPSFKHAFRRRRCLIFADSFYEWYRVPDSKAKIPIRVHMADGRPFAFGGLWESWKQPSGDALQSCVIITTEPNELMARIHHRMPAIVGPESYDDWLDPAARSPETLQPLLRPFEAELMAMHPVSSLVNSPASDDPSCITPVESSDFIDAV